MARVKLTAIITEASGNMDKVVYYNRLGTQCTRAYVIPRNPDTEAQRESRKAFAEAVQEWQNLPEEEKTCWNRKAAALRRKGKTGKTGYSTFLSHYLKNPAGRI